MMMSMDGQVDHDARACVWLADDFAIAAEGAGAFLDAVQAEVFTALTARQCNGRVESPALIRNIQKHLMV